MHIKYYFYEIIKHLIFRVLSAHKNPVSNYNIRNYFLHKSDFIMKIKIKRMCDIVITL